MPNQPVTAQSYLPAVPPGQVPAPCSITPALLKTHSITPAEYESLHAKLGRTPSLTELGIFSVMWSEHCSYKSSRVHLKRLPTVGERTSGPGSVVQGPGENAGIIDVGDGWACAFKIESHNHPSYIEPYQGAATGVGGILRDIFTMNARPMAIMDSLRFGPLTPHDESATPDGTDYHRNRHTMEGVVHGVAGYGNCFGVPNLGGESRFEPCYSGNPLVNAFALGLVRKDEIFYAKATGVGNPVIYVGAKTGRDGIHGATMASEEFTEGSEQKRPNVQMGDPFLEKLLLEACLEAMATGAVLGIQDMGAAGLTCSTCEMGARGELGVSIELDLVPQRETGMSSYEIMLSESQERMLLVAQAGREHEVLAIFLKWGLDASIVGEVTADDVMRVFHHGTLIAEIPNKALTDEAPVYHRPVDTWKAPVPLDPPAWVLEELNKPRDYTADLKKLLASPNICSKKWIYEQYDSMVQTNTVQGPGGEAGVIRIKGTGQSARQGAEGSAGQSPRQESFLGRVASLIASSTPEGEATLGTRNEDAANPVVAPDASHASFPSPPIPAAPSSAMGGGSLSLESATSDFLGPATLAAPAEHLDPQAVEHSLLGKLASFIAQSTPEAEAVHLTGNQDAANPVVAPDVHHNLEASAAVSPGAPSLAASPLRRGVPSQVPERGLAMALAGNGRWCYLDPKLGAMHAVAEAARKVACTGATPVAATNCLNFGNPEKPEIMAQLSEAIDGIAEACRALGTPITGGNVSLYNETKGEGIYPTPVIGVVGILDDVTKAVPSGFQRVGETVLLLGETTGPFDGIQQLGSSEFAKTLIGQLWGAPPQLQTESELALNRLLKQLSSEKLITSAADVSDGGLAVTLARAALQYGIGMRGGTFRHHADPPACTFFSESTSRVVVTCSKVDVSRIESIADKFDVAFVYEIGETVSATFHLDNGKAILKPLNDESAGVDAEIDCTVEDLRNAYSFALVSHLAAEDIG